MRYRGRIVGHENLIVESLQALAQAKDLQFEFTGVHEWGSSRCALMSEDWEADFCVQQMPGCCGVLVIYYVNVKPRTQEIFDLVLSLIEEAAKEAGFGSVAMTQVVPAYSRMLWDKEPWILSLKRDWRYSKAFRNRKSNNLITYLTKDMNQPIEREESCTRSRPSNQ